MRRPPSSTALVVDSVTRVVSRFGPLSSRDAVKLL
jgi:hypothetical protein